MAICDRGGLPIAVHVASASPYEPHLVPATLDARFLPDLPWCLIGDRGYDSDGLDDLLMTQYGIEMIAANRRGRAKTQDMVQLLGSRVLPFPFQVLRFPASLPRPIRSHLRQPVHIDGGALALFLGGHRFHQVDRLREVLLNGGA
jgi:hypothetical protein